MPLPTINQEYFVDFLVKLLNIASPTGFAEPAIDFVEKELSQYKQLELSRTRKGALVAKWDSADRCRERIADELTARCLDRTCGYAWRGGERDQIKRTVKVGPYWRDLVAEC